MHKYFNYLQGILKRKVSTKVMKYAKLRSLGVETQRSIKSGGGVQALKVRIEEFASLKVENAL